MRCLEVELGDGANGREGTVRLRVGVLCRIEEADDAGRARAGVSRCPKNLTVPREDLELESVELSEACERRQRALEGIEDCVGQREVLEVRRSDADEERVKVYGWLGKRGRANGGREARLEG
jgi:hypothetical protein